MYVEIAPRQSGKSYNIAVEVLKILRKDVNAKVAITAHIRDAIIDLEMKIIYLGISSQEYNRIHWFNVADRNWMHGKDFYKYHTVFFDEFAHMRYVEPMRNGYYVGTPNRNNNENIIRIIKSNGGKYVRKERTCRLHKKEHKGKGKTNLSR